MRHGLVALGLLAACAGPEGPDGASPSADRDCFNSRFVSGYGIVDRDTISVSAGPARDYEIALGGARCIVDWTQRLAIETTTSTWICVGAGEGQGYIHFRDPATRERVRCDIVAVRRAEASAPASGS